VRKPNGRSSDEVFPDSGGLSSSGGVMQIGGRGGEGGKLGVTERERSKLCRREPESELERPSWEKSEPVDPVQAVEDRLCDRSKYGRDGDGEVSNVDWKGDVVSLGGVLARREIMDGESL